MIALRNIQRNWDLQNFWLVIEKKSSLEAESNPKGEASAGGTKGIYGPPADAELKLVTGAVGTSPSWAMHTDCAAPATREFRTVRTGLFEGCPSVMILFSRPSI